MTTKTPSTIPTDFAVLEAHIRRARIERSVAIAQSIATIGEAIGRGLRRFANAMGRGLDAERDRRAIEADSFLKRSVPKY
jgi:hypothetical protein